MIGAAKCAVMASFVVTGPTDPYYANVTSLLHFDGTDGSSTFTDQKGVVYTPTGSPTLSAANAKFGSAAGNFINSSYLKAGSSTAFAPGTGDFTVELWSKIPSFSGYQGFFDTRELGTGFVLYIPPGQNMSYLGIGGNFISSIAFSTTEYHHVAVSRQSGTVRLFIDGALAGSVADTTNYPTATLAIGAGYNGSSPLAGYIDEFRWTNGVARYTAAFTPPTAAFPNA